MCSPKAGAGRVGSAGVRLIFTGCAELAHRAELGLLHLDHHLAGADQLRVERLVDVEHRLDAAVVLVVEGLPLVAACASGRPRRPRARPPSPGASNCSSIRSGRSTPLQKAAQNFGSSAPQLTQPSLAS